MRFVLLIINIVLFKYCLFPQDKIYLSNKHYLSGKILEINDDDVIFQNLANQSATFQIIKKREIDFIKFKNGEIDEFEKRNRRYHINTPEYTSSDQILAYRDWFVVQWPLKNFKRQSNTIYYESIDSRHVVNKNLLATIINLEPDSIKKIEMKNCYKLIKRKKRISKIMFAGAISVTGIGLGMMFGTYALYSTNGDTTLVLPTSLFLGAGLSIGTIEYFIYSRKKNTVQQMVNLLNQ